MDKRLWKWKLRDIDLNRSGQCAEKLEDANNSAYSASTTLCSENIHFSGRHSSYGNTDYIHACAAITASDFFRRHQRLNPARDKINLLPLQV